MKSRQKLAIFLLAVFTVTQIPYTPLAPLPIQQSAELQAATNEFGWIEDDYYKPVSKEVQTLCDGSSITIYGASNMKYGTVKIRRVLEQNGSNYLVAVLYEDNTLLITGSGECFRTPYQVSLADLTGFEGAKRIYFKSDEPSNPLKITSPIDFKCEDLDFISIYDNTSVSLKKVKVKTLFHTGSGKVNIEGCNFDNAYINASGSSKISNAYGKFLYKTGSVDLVLTHGEIDTVVSKSTSNVNNGLFSFNFKVNDLYLENYNKTGGLLRNTYSSEADTNINIDTIYIGGERLNFTNSNGSTQGFFNKVNAKKLICYNTSPWTRDKTEAEGNGYSWSYALGTSAFSESVKVYAYPENTSLVQVLCSPSFFDGRMIYSGTPEEGTYEPAAIDQNTFYLNDADLKVPVQYNSDTEVTKVTVQGFGDISSAMLGDDKANNTLTIYKNGLTTLPEGEYTVHIEFNNKTQIRNAIKIVKDLTKPTISDVQVTKDEENKTATITISATDNLTPQAELTYAISTSPDNFVASPTFSVNKNKTFTVYVKDKGGNVAERNVTVSDLIVEDTEKPVIQRVDVEVNPTNRKLIVTPTAEDDVTASSNLVYSFDNSTFESAPLELSADGTYTLYAKDESGKVSEPFEFTTTKLQEYLQTGSSPSFTPNPTPITADGTADIKFGPINMGTEGKGATDVTNIYIGDGRAEVPSDKWSFNPTTKEVTINKDYITTLDNDTDYKVYIKLNDNDNTELDVGTIHKTEPSLADTVPPTITDAQVSELNTSKTSCTITVTANDDQPGELSYSKNGTSWQRSNIITVTRDGEYTVYVKDASGNISSTSVSVTKFADAGIVPGGGNGTSQDKLPGINAIKNIEFDKNNANDITIEGFQMGEGSTRASGITSITVNAIPVPNDKWSYDTDYRELKISKEYLSTLVPSAEPYKVKATYDDPDETSEAIAKLLIKDTTPTAPTGDKPTAEASNVIYDGNSITYSLTYGTGDYQCDNLTSVSINGSKISTNYYTVSGNTLELDSTYLDCLQQGAYTVEVEFNDTHTTKISDKLSFIIPKVSEDTSWVNEDTSVLNVLWNRNSTYDLNVPLNSRRNVVSVSVDNMVLEAFIYNKSTGILTIPNAELSRLELGTHSFVVRFAPMDTPTETLARSINTFSLFNTNRTLFARDSFDNPRLGIVTNIVDYGTSGLTYSNTGNGTIITGSVEPGATPSIIEIPDTISGRPVQVTPGAIPQDTAVTGGQVAKDYSNQNGNDYINQNGQVERPSTNPGNTNNSGNSTNPGNQQTTGGGIHVDPQPNNPTSSSTIINNYYDRNSGYNDNYNNSYNESKQREIDNLKKELESYKSKQSSLESELKKTKLELKSSLGNKIPYILPVGALDDLDIEVKPGINKIVLNKEELGSVYGIQMKGHDTDYLDVKPSYWGYLNIMTCARNTLIPEIDDQTFLPNATITDGDAIHSIIKTLCLKDPKQKYNRKETEEIYKESGLTYTPEGEEYYYSMYLISMYGKQVTPILSQLNNNIPLTRQSAADLLYTIFKSNIYTSPTAPVFKDINTNLDENIAVKFVACADLLKGDSQGKFNPDKSLTRAEFATLICNLYFKL